jgi:hypothetical protein
MFIELIIVGVIIALLYERGFLQFGSGTAIAISIAAAVLASALGFVFTHFVARKVVDQIFGFDRWAPKAKPLPTKVLDSATVSVLDSASADDLAKFLKEHPADPEVARFIAEIYLKRGDIELFVQERLKMIRAGNLTKEEVCTAYYRLADVLCSEGRPVEAIRYLRQVVINYPGTVEADNAQKRCRKIEAEENVEAGGTTV